MNSGKDQINWSLSRKIISIIAAIALVVSMTPSAGTTTAFATGGSGAILADAATFSGGTGAQDDPYQIATAADMKALSEAVAGGETYADTYFKMTADVDLSTINETSWTPIGDATNVFAGVFNGQNNTVEGLNVNGDVAYAGLFGVVSGSILNVNVAGTVASTAADGYVGGIAGKLAAGGIITDCKNSCDLTGINAVGGIVGLNAGTIVACFNEGTATGEALGEGENAKGAFGGICGYNGDPEGSDGGVISFCWNLGNVDTVRSLWAGGLAGFQSSDSETSNSYNAGLINFTNDADGGTHPLIGESDGETSNCLWLNDDTETASANYVSSDGDGVGGSGTIEACVGKSSTELATEDAVTLLNTAASGAGTAWIASRDDEGYNQFPILDWQRESYKVTFVDEEGTEVSEAKFVEVGGDSMAVAQPADPEKEGYTFGGWFTDDQFGTSFDFTKDIAADTTVYAKFTINEYTVTFNTDGGTKIDDETVEHGQVVAKPETDPVKEGYDFGGWFTDNTFATEFNFETPITGNTTVYAKFTIKKFTVKFETNGGKAIADQTVEWGKTATQVTPVRDGYDFVNWYVKETLEGNTFNFSTPIKEDTTIYAKWKGATQDTTDADGVAHVYDSTLDTVISISLKNTASEKVANAKVKIADNGFLTVILPTVTLTGNDLAELASTKKLTVTVKTQDNKPVTDRPVTVQNYAARVIDIDITNSRGIATAAVEVADIPIYRLYNPYSGEHLFTTNLTEVTDLTKMDWSYEDVAWQSPETSGTPVYRLYNKYSGEHFFTSVKKEYDDLKTMGWTQEGIAWYSDESEGVPVYRLFNPWAEVGTHLFTTSKDEYDYLFDQGWNQEDISWYGVK